MTTQPLIELQEVCKVYNQGRPNEVRALYDINLDIAPNSVTCLKGPSGSGKSTLLSIIGCVFPPTSGRVTIAGKAIARLPDRFMTIHRRQKIGFIFQQFNILPDLSVQDNITLPLLPLGVPPAERRKRAFMLMEMLELTNRASFPAGQISGGQLQRVAIARALVNDPPIILADEPTAHLDRSLSETFMEIMGRLRHEGKTIILTSHDDFVTSHPLVERMVTVEDGTIHAA